MDMSRVKKLDGQKFNHWSVIKFSHAVGSRAYWLCECDCDAKTQKAVWGADLKRGMSGSCGCATGKMISEKLSKHKMCEHPAYRSWVYLRSRCNNPNDTSYYLYGGKGVKVNERWNDFDAFWEDMGPTWAEGLSIDRFPNKEGNYEPGNCRWATPKMQARNRSTERIIDTPSGKMSIVEASETYGVSQVTIQSRLRYGWTDPAEIVKPPRPMRPRTKKVIS